MRNIKYIVSIVLIILLSLVTYIYFNKQPVESTPNRATLVFMQESFDGEAMEVAI